VSLELKLGATCPSANVDRIADMPHNLIAELLP
jgi:hypothetical protein